MFNLSFTIGSFFFILLLTISYYPKEKFYSLRNRIYRYFLIEEIMLLVTEIVAGLYLEYVDNYVIALLLHRLHWITGILYGIFLFYYGAIFIKNTEITTIKELITKDKFVKVISVIFAISFIVYFFIPFDQLDRNNVSYIPGPAAYYIFAFCFFSVVMLSIYLLINKKYVDYRTRIAIFGMIMVLLLLFTFQFIFPNIAFSGLASATMLFVLYFIIENPDLRLIRNIKVKKDELEGYNNAKTDFLLNMSHEIITPMNKIIGSSEFILKSKSEDINVVRNNVENIYNAGNNLLDIINNILDISKIETSKEELNLKEYLMSNIIIELSNVIESRIGSKPIKLILDIDPNIPNKLYGDSTKIYQILLNILTNSVKYTDLGKIKLSVKGDIKEDSINLHFGISDTGYGIKKEDYDKLFSKFSRLDSAQINEVEGTGLGLVITKNYVDLMGGKIWLESEYQVGTTFYVDISQKIIDYEPIGNMESVVTTNINIDYIDCSKYNVLVVDDSKLNSKVTSRIFDKYKFNIEIVESGLECINAIKGGKHYDIIFLDHMMPEMDGVETLHIIKKLEDFDIPPVIALTANAITGMKEMYIKEGFDDYLSKPINMSDLDKIIKKYFNK